MNCGLGQNDNPCKDCIGERKVGCHSTCIKYTTWKKEWDKARNKRNIETRMQQMAAFSKWPRRIR